MFYQNNHPGSVVKKLHVDLNDQQTIPYILMYKSNFLDVKMGSKNRPRLIFGRT